jgi:hypothetical protein
MQNKRKGNETKKKCQQEKRDGNNIKTVMKERKKILKTLPDQKKESLKKRVRRIVQMNKPFLLMKVILLTFLFK